MLRPRSPCLRAGRNADGCAWRPLRLSDSRITEAGAGVTSLHRLRGGRPIRVRPPRSRYPLEFPPRAVSSGLFRLAANCVSHMSIEKGFSDPPLFDSIPVPHHCYTPLHVSSSMPRTIRARKRLDTNTSLEADETLKRLIASGGLRIILDLGNLDYISSSRPPGDYHRFKKCEKDAWRPETCLHETGRRDLPADRVQPAFLSL